MTEITLTGVGTSYLVTLFALLTLSIVLKLIENLKKEDRDTSFNMLLPPFYVL